MFSVTDFQVLLCVVHHALRGPPLLHYSAGGRACPAAHDKMTSQSCQRGPGSAHTNYKGPCRTAFCSHTSSLRGCNLEPPNRCGGQSKPVPPGTVGSSWVTGLLRMLLLLWYMSMAGRMWMEWEGTGRRLSLLLSLVGSAGGPTHCGGGPLSLSLPLS